MAILPIYETAFSIRTFSFNYFAISFLLILFFQIWQIPYCTRIVRWRVHFRCVKIYTSSRFFLCILDTIKNLFSENKHSFILLSSYNGTTTRDISVQSSQIVNIMWCNLQIYAHFKIRNKINKTVPVFIWVQLVV